MQHESESHNLPTSDRLFSRRKFLAAVAGGVVGGVTYKVHEASQLPKPPENTVEWNPDISRHLVMIDFAPDTYDPDFVQGVYFSDDELLSRELGDDYLGPERRKIIGGTYMGINELSQRSELLANGFERIGLSGTMEEQFLRNNPHFAIATHALGEVGDHGEGVSHVMWQTINSVLENNSGITPRIYPIQKVMNIDFSEDYLGNYTLTAKADAEKIIEALSHYSEQQIVNFSWQAGDVKISAIQKKYGENCVIESLGIAEPDIQGAYRPEAAGQNLRELFSICDTYPDKFFFAAIGNNNDDIRQARVDLKHEWPDNVLMIGSWKDDEEYGFPNFHAYGADIYVKNYVLGNGRKTSFDAGSSFSTAQMSALGAYLLECGLKVDELRDFFLGTASDEVFYTTEKSAGKHLAGSIERTRIYNPSNLTSYLGPRIAA